MRGGEGMTQVVYFGAGDLGEGGKEGMKERENWGLGEGGGGRRPG